MVHALNEARGKKEGALNEAQHTKKSEDVFGHLLEAHDVLFRAPWSWPKRRLLLYAFLVGKSWTRVILICVGTDKE